MITANGAIEAFFNGQDKPVQSIKSFDKDFFNMMASESEADTSDFLEMGENWEGVNPPKGIHFFNTLAGKPNQPSLLGGVKYAAKKSVSEIGTRSFQILDIAEGAVSLPIMIGMMALGGFFIWRKYK